MEVDNVPMEDGEAISHPSANEGIQEEASEVDLRLLRFCDLLSFVNTKEARLLNAEEIENATKETGECKTKPGDWGIETFADWTKCLEIEMTWFAEVDEEPQKRALAYIRSQGWTLVADRVVELLIRLYA